MYRTFFERFGHQGVVILPNMVLCDDPLTDAITGEELPSLREQVSLVDDVYHRQLCYARVLSPCGDSLYWALVAATPNFVNAQRVVLTEEALYFALPWDIRLQGKCSGDILTAMQAHAQAIRPVQRVVPESFQSQREYPRYDTSQSHPQEQPKTPEAATLIPLPELFVSYQTVDEVITESLEPSYTDIPSHPTSWARLVWLRAALAMVRRQMRHSRQVFAKLDVLLDKVVDAQCHMRQSLVSANPVQIGNRLVGWRLTIALPLAEVLA